MGSSDEAVDVTPPARVSLAAGPGVDPRRDAERDAAKHADEIVFEIEQDILFGRCTPGTRLDERALAERFGVSRTPVREALHRLSARGLISLRGRQGAQLAALPVSDLLDAFFVVAELEGMAALLAARRVRPAERQAILAAQAGCAAASRAGDERAFVHANAAFHDAIIGASRNRLLQVQLHSARLVVAPYRFLATSRPGRMDSSIPEHQAVIEAVFSGDGQTASKLMSTHVNLLGEHLSDLLRFLEDRTGTMAR